MKITQGSIIAALALAATSPAMGAPVGMTSPDPANDSLSPRANQGSAFAGHRPALRRSTGAPIKMVERGDESMIHGLGFDMEERSLDESMHSLAERTDPSLINPLPVVGPIVGPLLDTVANTVAGLPIVGGVVQTVGRTAAGLPIAGPLVKTLGDGLNLGPLVDPPKSLLAQPGNNFAAQQQQQIDPVTGLLSNVPIAGGLVNGLNLGGLTGGLTNGLPLNTATGLLNNLPLGQVVQTAQGALPLGSVLGAAGGLTGGLTNNLPLVGGGGNPLAALTGIVGSDGQTYYSGSALQGLLGGNLGQVGQAAQQLQQTAQPVTDQLQAADNTAYTASTQAWNAATNAAQDPSQALSYAQQLQQQQQAAVQAQLQQYQQQVQAQAQAAQRAGVPQQAAGVFAQAQQLPSGFIPAGYHAFKAAEPSGSGVSGSAPLPIATPAPSVSAFLSASAAEPSAMEAFASPMSLLDQVSLAGPTSMPEALPSAPTSIPAVLPSAPTSLPAITFSAATPSAEFPTSILAPTSSLAVPSEVASSAITAATSGAPLSRRNTILNAQLAPLRLDVQAGDFDDEDEDCDFVSCDDGYSVKSKSVKKMGKMRRFAAKMKRFLKV